MHRSGRLAAVAAVWCLATPRAAVGQPLGSLSQSLWPAPLPDDRTPSADVADPELARRPAELIASAGPLLFDCLPLVALCEPRNAVPRLSAGALWRAAPSFAWGGTLSVAGSDDAGFGTTILAALTARLYTSDRGAVDPYFELSLGAGRFARRVGSGKTLRAQGMTAEAGGGVDFHLAPRLRFGPALRYGQFILGPSTTCDDGACTDGAFASIDPKRGFATLLVNVTVLAGEVL
jgi:hypothetical protein